MEHEKKINEKHEDHSTHEHHAKHSEHKQGEYKHECQHKHSHKNDQYLWFMLGLAILVLAVTVVNAYSISGILSSATPTLKAVSSAIPSAAPTMVGGC